MVNSYGLVFDWSKLFIGVSLKWLAFHKVKQRRSWLVAEWVTAVLDFVEDPTNA